MYVAAAIDPGLGSPDAYAVGLLFVGVAVLVAILALSHQRARAYSASIVYLAMGAAAAAGIALLDAPWLDLLDDHTTVERASEIAVFVALFAAGLRLDRRLRWRAWRSTALLLGVVMPLTIAAVAAFGAYGMGLSAGAAIVLGAALAPTDPVLAGELGVGPPGEREEAEPAFALTSEAGLNDGLAFPFVLLGLVVAGGAGPGGIAEWLAADVVYATLAGVAIGAAGGWALSALAARLRERSLVARELDGWAALGAVLAIYGLTQVAGAYGFLAAFAGGIAFRRRERDHEYNTSVHAGAATVEKMLELAMILLLGSLLTLDGLEAPGLAGWLLAPLLLLVVRPAASAVGLVGSPMAPRERAWVAWFGVRGVGSLYYAAAAVGAGVLAPAEEATVAWTVVAVVVVSIVVHGVTGAPLTRRLLGEQALAEEPAESVAARVTSP
ncbi:MAG TPA: cation:proton antiporter [Miltoncostaeaceae bacterium]|nr:cation:proton antiporter [Miltoncostaeaceae bacterium]